MDEEKTGEIRDEQGRFIPGVSGNQDGRPPMTEEQRIIKKATKELIAEYKEKLTQALPRIEPVLVDKAISGDMQAIKEINDRTMGKAPQSMDLTTGGDKITPIYGGGSIQKHFSNEKDIQPDEEDKSSSGGDSSVKNNIHSDLAD